MTTITGQIDRIEKEIEKNEARLDTIERLQRLKDMPNDEWECLKDERKTLEKLLKAQSKRSIESRGDELRGLRWENRKSMLFSVLVLGLLYMAYLFFFAAPYKEQSNTQR